MKLKLFLLLFTYAQGKYVILRFNLKNARVKIYINNVSCTMKMIIMNSMDNHSDTSKIYRNIK